MKKETIHTLMTIAVLGLLAAGCIFLCLSLLGYGKTWTLPVALGCIGLSMLFQLISRQSGK